MTKKYRDLSILVVCLLLAGILAACGDNTPTTASTTTAASATTASGAAATTSAAGTSAAAANPPTGPDIPLRIGYIGDTHGGGIISVANDKGYWKQAGITPSIKSFSNGPLQITAMAAGDLDIAYIGPGAAWLAAQGQAVIVTVDSLNTGDYLIASPSSGVTSINDLKGKKVGVPLGTSGEMILQLALQKAKIDPKDVQITNLDPAAVVTAFIGGQIDVAAIWSPLSSQIKQRMPDAKFLVDDTAFFPTYTFPQMWVASPKLVKENPEAVKRFLKAFILANDYRAAHIDEMINLTAKLTGAPAADLKNQTQTTQWLTSADIQKANTDGSTMKWFNGLVQMFLLIKKLPNAVPAENFVNTDLFAQALK
ncbi:MAG TPA: aliphatic sulfonate ABC transporter substrate-binding protein [Chloroflexia bacterium]|nr:aliphatic sulfonate ABC transporter substrate-binding protein [Chloroflexia bacterium]